MNIKFICILVLGLVFNTQQIVCAEKQQDLSHDSAQVFLHKFYTEYEATEDYYKSMSLIRQYSTPWFVHKVLDDSESDSFDASPILCTQDSGESLPETLQIIPLVKDKNYNVCYIPEIRYNDYTICLEVTIIKENDKYLIDNIKCSYDE